MQTEADGEKLRLTVEGTQPDEHAHEGNGHTGR